MALYTMRDFPKDSIITGEIRSKIAKLVLSEQNCFPKKTALNKCEREQKSLLQEIKHLKKQLLYISVLEEENQKLKKSNEKLLLAIVEKKDKVRTLKRKISYLHNNYRKLIYKITTEKE